MNVVDRVPEKSEPELRSKVGAPVTGSWRTTDLSGTVVESLQLVDKPAKTATPATERPHWKRRIITTLVKTTSKRVRRRSVFEAKLGLIVVPASIQRL